MVTMLENDPDFMSADVYVHDTTRCSRPIRRDSDDEDQPVSLNHLSRQQLCAEAEARVVRCIRRSARLSDTNVTITESNGITDGDDAGDDDDQRYPWNYVQYRR